MPHHGHGRGGATSSLSTRTSPRHTYTPYIRVLPGRQGREECDKEQLPEPSSATARRRCALHHTVVVSSRHTDTNICGPLSTGTHQLVRPCAVYALVYRGEIRPMVRFGQQVGTGGLHNAIVRSAGPRKRGRVERIVSRARLCSLGAKHSWRRSRTRRRRGRGCVLGASHVSCQSRLRRWLSFARFARGRHYRGTCGRGRAARTLMFHWALAAL